MIGVEGLAVSQLGQLRFTVKGSTACAGAPRFNLYVDTNDDGVGDTTRAYTCTTGGSVNVFSPVSGGPGAPALAGGARVVGLDLVLGSAGTVNLDQFVVAGIVVDDFRTFNVLGPVACG